MMKKALLMLALCLALAAPSFGQGRTDSAAQTVATLGNLALGAPVLLKTLVPLALIPEMLRDTDAILPGALGLGLVSLPNAILLSRLLANDPLGVARWRRVVRVTDTSMALGLIGYGTYLIATSDQSGWGDMAGWLSLGAALPLLVASILDGIPFPMERATLR